MDIREPQKIISYFKKQWKLLVLITISGIIYNVGLLAGPFFEGQLVQCLDDIIKQRKTFSAMLITVIAYLVITLIVQGSRYYKRLQVRKFANNINKDMKQIIYANLINKTTNDLEKQNVGSIITKAVSDVDDCAEGMRKFTTEIFDTGVALAGYIVMLLIYDYKLALLCLIFPPLTYLMAEKMKVKIQKANEVWKESRGELNSATLERVNNEITYRLFSVKEQADQRYINKLADYRQKAITANLKSAMLPSLYQTIAMIGVVFIIYFGSRNVLTGIWNIASFTTFLSCYSKLSTKSSKAAKLFNSVQQAEVSWNRIKPLLNKPQNVGKEIVVNADKLEVNNLSVYKNDENAIFENISFQGEKGQIIGISGPIACGKTTLGKLFLNEKKYQGTILVDNRTINELNDDEKMIAYLGHDLELFDGSIEDNILLGENEDVRKYLHYVSLDEEVNANTNVQQLSGGQKQRVALARCLAHPRPIFILDDPFSALDKKTEKKVFDNLRKLTTNNIVLLISHRLYLFDEVDKVLWLEDGKGQTDAPDNLLRLNKSYRQMYLKQTGGNEDEK